MKCDQSTRPESTLGASRASRPWVKRAQSGLFLVATSTVFPGLALLGACEGDSAYFGSEGHAGEMAGVSRDAGVREGAPSSMRPPGSTSDRPIRVRVRNNTGADLSLARVALEDASGVVLTAPCDRQGWAEFNAVEPEKLPINLTVVAPGASVFSYVDVDSRVIAEAEGGISLWLNAPITNGASLSTAWPASGEAYSEVVIWHSQGLPPPGPLFQGAVDPWLLPALGDEALSLLGIEVANVGALWTNAWRRFDHDGIPAGQVEEVIWSEPLDTTKISLWLPRPPLGHKLRGSALTQVDASVAVLEHHRDRPGSLPLSLVLSSNLGAAGDTYSLELEHVSSAKDGSSVWTKYQIDSDTESSWTSTLGFPSAGGADVVWPEPPADPFVAHSGEVGWRGGDSEASVQLSVTGPNSAWHLVAPPGTSAIRFPALPDGMERTEVLDPGEEHTLTLGHCKRIAGIPGCGSGATSSGYPIRFQ